MSAHKWVLNINAEDEAGLTKLGRTEVTKGATLDEAMAKAKKFIEELWRRNLTKSRGAMFLSIHKSLARQSPRCGNLLRGHRDEPRTNR